MKKLITLLLCAVVLFGTASGFTASAEAFDSSRRGIITLHYTDENGEGFADMPIAAYRVATVQSNLAFGLVAPFSSYPINVNGIKSQAEWKTAANTLASYIEANNIMPHSIIGTDDHGTATFINMHTGLYLVPAMKAEKNGTVYSFESFFVILPRPDGTGFDYTVDAKPKWEKYSGHLKYLVTKLWQDSENPDPRPQSVDIEIYRDGILQETQVLNAENYWSYYWQDPDGKGSWTVVEKNTPQNYTVSISRNENVITIVNKYNPPQKPDDPDKPDKPDKPDNPTPPPEKPADSMPDTGDISNSGIYFAVMCVSGLVLVILGILTGRKRR